MFKKIILTIMVIFTTSSFAANISNVDFSPNSAFERSQISGKPVYLLVVSSRCKHCFHHLQITIEPNFDAIIQDFEFALVDIAKGDKLPANLPFDNTTPTTYVLSPNGRMLANEIKGDFSPDYLFKFINILKKHYTR